MHGNDDWACHRDVIPHTIPHKEKRVNVCTGGSDQQAFIRHAALCSAHRINAKLLNGCTCKWVEDF